MAKNLSENKGKARHAFLQSVKKQTVKAAKVAVLVAAGALGSDYTGDPLKIMQATDSLLNRSKGPQ